MELALKIVLGVVFIFFAVFLLPLCTGYMAKRTAAAHGQRIRWGRLWCVCLLAALAAGGGAYLYTEYVGSDQPTWQVVASVIVFVFGVVQMIAPFPLFGVFRVSRWVSRPLEP